MRIKWLERTMLYAPHLALCLSEDEYKVACKRLKVQPGEWLSGFDNARVHTFEREGESLACLVCARTDRDVANQTLTFAHEALHVFRRWLEFIGEECPGEEIEAHCIHNIAASLIEEYIARGGGCGCE